MRNLLLFLHLPAATFWMGGMAFMLLALRPALHPRQEPPLRLPLVVEVLRRFFLVVICSIAALLATGVPLLVQVRGGSAPRGGRGRGGRGVLMMLVLGHIFFVPWRRLQRAVAAQDWPAGGRAMNQIALLVKVNLALGWLAIAAVLLWR